MNKKIPQPIIATLADHISLHESHAKIDSLFMYADAPGEPPELSKQPKVLEWLRRINKESDEPLAILGRIIENYMEIGEPADSHSFSTSNGRPIDQRIGDPQPIWVGIPFRRFYFIRFITSIFISQGSHKKS